MKAIVLDRFGDTSNLKLKEREIPQPKSGEVRIHLRASGFNPVDFKIREGHFGGEPPLVLGCECSGVIDAKGAGVIPFNEGDEVMAFVFGQASNGTYAEYVCLPIDFVVKKPKNLSFEQAAAVPLTALTAYRALIATSAVKENDTIFIAGAAGGVGSFAVQLAKIAGAKAIFTVAGSEDTASYLQEKLGVPKDHIVLYPGLTLPQMQEKLIAMNQGNLFDASFDLVGHEMKRLCLQLTCHSGHFSTVTPESGKFDFPVWERGVSLAFNRNLSLHFVFVGSEAVSGPPHTWQVYARHLKAIAKLIEEGRLGLPHFEVIGGLEPDTVREAHRLLEAGKIKGKLVMAIS